MFLRGREEFLKILFTIKGKWLRIFIQGGKIKEHWYGLQGQFWQQPSEGHFSDQVDYSWMKWGVHQLVVRTQWAEI